MTTTRSVSSCGSVGPALFALALMLAGTACQSEGSSAERHPEHQARLDQPGEDHAGHDHAGGTHADCVQAGSDHADHAHEGHDHASGGDLDQSVESLLAQRCEHDLPAYRCEECRYEVGIAQVPPELIASGLVEVVEIAPGPLTAEIELSGEIQFDERLVVHLGPSAPGIVRRAAVDLGQSVAAGDLLVELESTELGEAQADFLEARAAERVAERALGRQNELRAAQITSEREHLEAVQRHEEARIRAQAVRQALARYGLTGEEIAALERDGLSATTGVLRLRAPLAGEVLALHATRGERVEAGAEVIQIGDASSLWVWVDLYEDQLAALRGAQLAGAPASITVRAYPGERFPGRLDFVGRVMDATTRTVRARVTVPNPTGELRPGMFARVRLTAGPTTRGLAVPTAALLSDEGRDFVFVHCTEDYYVRRPIVAGRRDQGHVEVVSGLVPGQAIVTTGAFLLKSDVLRQKMGEGCAH